MKKFTTLILVVLAATAIAYAYESGYCLKAGCSCHKYTGGTWGQDKCTTCGHAKAAHS